MKNWISCVLLLHCTAVTVSQKGCIQENAVAIIGNVTTTRIAGRLEICVGGRWHAVYDGSWDEPDVRLVCAERGFPPGGARACSGSCFGASDLMTGYTNFICRSRTSFSMCNRTLENRKLPQNNAGIVCISPDATMRPLTSPCPDTISSPETAACTCPEVSDLPSSCPEIVPCTSPESIPCPDCTISPTSIYINSSGLQVAATEPAEKKTDPAIGASLGAVCICLLIALVGVATGWVWSCQRNKPKRNNTALENPCYESARPTIPQYSSLGPRDTPSGHTSPPGGEEVAYNILESRNEKKKVPIPTKSHSREEGAERKVDMAYSTLNHN